MIETLAYVVAMTVLGILLVAIVGRILLGEYAESSAFARTPPWLQDLLILAVPRLYRTDPEWDAELNALLDAGSPVALAPRVATIGGVSVWIENWPYGFGGPYGRQFRRASIADRRTPATLPARRTQLRLYRAILAAERAGEGR